MSPETILKMVKSRFPGLAKIPKSQLKLVEQAVVYAGRISQYDLVTDEEHEKFMKELEPEGGLTPGGFMRTYRTREDLTQVDLAQKTGIPQANISAMERGKRPIGLKTARKLAKALNCNVQRLIS